MVDVKQIKWALGAVLLATLGGLVGFKAGNKSCKRKRTIYI